MTHRARVLRNIAVVTGCLILTLIFAAIAIPRTDWFRQFVRRAIVSGLHTSTGARVEIGAFAFDETHLTATISNLVMHGTEAAGEAPLASIGHIEARFVLFPHFRRLYGISALQIDGVGINIHDNIPTPETHEPSGNSPLQTVVDLAIGKLSVQNAAFTYRSVTEPFSLRGQNAELRLDFDNSHETYTGHLAIEPDLAFNVRNQSLHARLNVPLTIAKNRLDLHHATLATSRSQIVLDGAIEGLDSPGGSAALHARVSGADLAVIAGMREPLPDLVFDLDAAGNARTLNVKSLRGTFGHSEIKGSGDVKNPNGAGSLRVEAALALDELSRVFSLAGQPSGRLELASTVRLNSANQFEADGDLQIRDLTIRQGKERYSGISFRAPFHADSESIRLNGARIGAFGGELIAEVSLTQFRHYAISGQLRSLGIQEAAAAIGTRVPYQGFVSGTLQAEGDTSSVRSLNASTRLEISPAGAHGAPLSGHLSAAWKGTADDLTFDNSWLALPHTNVRLNGSLRGSLRVSADSNDLRDVLPSGAGYLSLRHGGGATFQGDLTGALSTPRLTGSVAVRQFAISGRPFDSFDAGLTLAPAAADLSHAVLSRDRMQIRAEGQLALNNWRPVSSSRVGATLAIENGDIGDLAVLAGQTEKGYSGDVSAAGQISGTFGNPAGKLSISASNGSILNQQFDRSQIELNLSDQSISIPTAYIEGAAGRVDLTASFRHPRDSFLRGQLQAHVQSAALNLSHINGFGSSSGSGSIAANVTGTLQDAEPRFLLQALDGDLEGRAVQFREIRNADLSARVRTTGPDVTYSLTGGFAGAAIRLNGKTTLNNGYPGSVDLQVTNLPVEPVLSSALPEARIPAQGILTISLHGDGPLAAMYGEGRIDLARGSLYGQPIDQAHIRASYLEKRIDVSQLELTAVGSHIDLSGTYSYPSGDVRSGVAQVRINSGHADLARIAAVQDRQPGLSGAVDITGDLGAALRGGDSFPVFTSLNTNISATGIARAGRQFGDLRFSALSRGGQRVQIALDSNLAGSVIHGTGTAELTPQYPVDTTLSFKQIAWSRLSPLMGVASAGQPKIEGLLDGDLRIQGPLLDARQLNGSLTVTRASISTVPGAAVRRATTIANDGQVRVTLNRGTLHIDSLHLTGPQTNIQVSGGASVTGENLNLNLQAEADIGLVRDFDPDIYSSGRIAITTAIKGTAAKPVVNGQLTLQNASFSTADLPVGLSNANGTILFNQQTARIQALTAEAGGGKVNVSGFASFSGGPRFSLKGDARGVRIRVQQQGFSVTGNANVALVSTEDGNRLSGTATVTRLTYTPQTDLGSILSRSAPSVGPPPSTSTFLTKTKLDIRVRNSPGMTVESSLSQDLESDVDLHIEGTASEPGAQGRVIISQGKLVFFGSDYSVNHGTISFYDAMRINPILDVSLQAQAQGVTVTLHVTGPIENLKLSYTSDPPLQFQEIVALLASGQTPTSDPTLLANQPAQTQQNLQQTGESALLGRAVANPVANQMQRVFGVTQLKIDPSFTTGSTVPTARLALQQRITNNLTFTYVSAIDEPNSTVIRMEWAFNPQWSAVATRDQNGIFSVNFFFKREFR